MKKILFAIVGILLIGMLVMLGVFLLKNANFISASEKSNETLVVRSLAKEGEISLVCLGIVDIYDTEKSLKIFGTDIIGTSRKTFIRGEFNAKLGINGEDVEITQVSENEYEIHIPRFIFIGFSDPKFTTAVEKNGVLSAFTENIDAADMITKILDTEGKVEYIEKYKNILEESAENFYRTIISSVNPDVVLTFTYGE